MTNYIQDYASTKLSSIIANELMQSKIKEAMACTIRRAVYLYNKGIITADEAALFIANA